MYSIYLSVYLSKIIQQTPIYPHHICCPNPTLYPCPGWFYTYPIVVAVVGKITFFRYTLSYPHKIHCIPIKKKKNIKFPFTLR